MTQLYTTYAALYHKMYQSFINYDEEYRFYKGLLDEKGFKNILEVGCGTGRYKGDRSEVEKGHFKG
jgi:hypothetical protein